MKGALASLFVMALTMLSSCGKGGINGKLDGMLQIMTIERLADGNVSHPDQKYIDIYLHTVNLASYGGVRHTANMYRDEEENKMSLEFPYQASDPSVLSPWGIYTAEVTFVIEKVNGKELVLRSPDAILTLRRF